jgi:hypothetical protein
MNFLFLIKMTSTSCTFHRSLILIALFGGAFSQAPTHAAVAESFLVYDASKLQSSWKWGYDLIAGVNHHRKAIACSLVDAKLLGVKKTKLSK